MLTRPPRQTLAVLNPFARVDQHLMDDSDLAGPILFFLCATLSTSPPVLPQVITLTPPA